MWITTNSTLNLARKPFRFPLAFPESRLIPIQNSRIQALVEGGLYTKFLLVGGELIPLLSSA
jgi:hypothetical protein